MLAQINPQALTTLRIAATFFFIINLLGGAYIFRNRHRFFDRDPNVDNDIPTVRRLRVEVIMIAKPNTAPNRIYLGRMASIADSRSLGA